MFIIDGMRWDVPCKIERSAEIRASEISGILLDKSYFNDVIGTYMSYTVSVAVPFGREADYNTIYEYLTNPVDGHAFILPYNSGTIEITGRVASVKDTWYKVGDGNYWEGCRFTVIANHPTKEMSLGEVLTRGASPLPAAESVQTGASYTYTSEGWETINDADTNGY